MKPITKPTEQSIQITQFFEGTDLSHLAVSLGWPHRERQNIGEFGILYCNGRPVLVLKHPQNAFPMFGKDWNATVGATVQQLKDLAIKVGVDLGKKVVKIYEDLNNTTAALSASYTANYLAFATDACNPESVEKLRQQNEKLSKAVLLLMMLQNEATRDSPDVARLQDLDAKLQDLLT